MSGRKTPNYPGSSVPLSMTFSQTNTIARRPECSAKYCVQEEFDLHDQARWKLERAVETSIASKRWDAVGVAAFALGELLGGNDTPTTAAALMLYQVYFRVLPSWPNGRN